MSMEYGFRNRHELIAELEQLRAENAELRKDAERLDALKKMLFEGKWNGVIGPGSARHWHIHGSYRHTLARFIGPTFRAAIDAAMEGK